MSTDKVEQLRSDVFKILSLQESLLQTYRGYMITLQALLAAGTAVFMAALSERIHDWSNVFGSSKKLDIPITLVITDTLQWVLLSLLIWLGWESLIKLSGIIENRGLNVSFAQRLLVMIEDGTFFKEYSADIDKIEKGSNDFFCLYTIFKFIEPSQMRSFVFTKKIDGCYEALARKMFALKESSAPSGKQAPSTRDVINKLIRRVFILFWTVSTIYTITLFATPFIR